MARYGPIESAQRHVRWSPASASQSARKLRTGVGKWQPPPSSFWPLEAAGSLGPCIEAQRRITSRRSSNAARSSAAVTASGVVEPAATTPVGAHVSGVIQALYCDANMKVKAGQLCAKIDPRPYQIVVDRAKADLAAAEARVRKGQSGSRPGASSFRAP